MRKQWLLVVSMAAAIVVGCGTKADNNKQTEAVPAIKSPDQDPVAYRYPIRNKNNKLVTLETNFGKMTLELYHDVAPAHADSFVARVNDGFYDSTIFHRVIAGFMIQGGDPTGTGTGNAGYTLPAEFSSLPHIEGTLSMARGPDRNSASCQFFICLGRAAHLDGQYTVFGHLIKGYDVLRAIGKVETVMDRWGREKSAPKEPVVLIHAYLSDAEGNPITPAG